MTSFETLVGYDPQLLLGYERKPGELWDAKTLKKYLHESADLWAELNFPPAFSRYDDYIDFEADRHIEKPKLHRREDGSVYLGHRAGKTNTVPVETRVMRLVVPVVGDYAGLEALVLAQMMRETGIGAVLLDLDHRGGEIGPRYFPMDLSSRSPPEEETKPDGRSLGYLKHDPTKRKGGRRR